MKPTFVYIDELTFKDEKKITLRFSEGKKTKKIYFRKTMIILLLALPVL